jgi:hypothetical protein
MKRCSCCKIEKQTDDFHKSKSQKDGLNNQCKECVRENGKRNADNIKISKKCGMVTYIQYGGKV